MKTQIIEDGTVIDLTNSEELAQSPRSRYETSVEVTSVNIPLLNRIRTLKPAICGVMLLALCVSSRPSYATATIVTGASALSYGVTATYAVGGSVVVGGAGAVVKYSSDSWWGDLLGDVLVVGGIAAAVVDPPDGTFYTGSWTIHYPGNLLQAYESGWLGDWGNNPSDPAPPAYPLGFPVAGSFVVHAPNSGLATTTVNDPVSGLQTTTFDWGPAGHAVDGTDPFNMFAALFQAKETVRLNYLGTSTSDAPAPGANFYITTPGVYCSVYPSNVISECGESQTQYFSVTPTPEPGTLLLLGSGVLGVSGFLRRRLLNRT